MRPAARAAAPAGPAEAPRPPMLRETFASRAPVPPRGAGGLKVRYRRSIIGFVWTMLQPLLMMLTFYLMFSQLFRSNLPHYPVYALAGILFWNFFSQSIVASMNSLRGNAQLLQKLPLPKAVFPIATVISGVVNLRFAPLPTP